MKSDSGHVLGLDLSSRPASEERRSSSGISPGSRRWLLIAAGAALLLVLGLWFVTHRGPWNFKIYVTESGVYRVTYEDLQQAGLGRGWIRSRKLALSHQGEEVPIWVADGDDGWFGPGDQLEFVGEHLLGHRSFYHEYTLLNVYRLAVGASEGRLMSSPTLPEETQSEATQSEVTARTAEPSYVEAEAHWEENNFLVHFFTGRTVAAPEPRFWVRMSHIDPEPFRRGDFWLGRSRPGSRPVSLAVELRGWSNAGKSQGGALPDHRADLYFNGHLVGSGEWNGHESHLIEAEVPDHLVKREEGNTVEVKIPRRRPSPSEDALIDVVLLNWISVRYPHPEAHSELGGSWIPDEPQRLVVRAPPGTDTGGGSSESADPAAQAKVRLATARGVRLMVYGEDGSRFDSQNMEVEDLEHSSLHHFYPPAREAVFHALPAGSQLPPAAVELDRPSQWKDPTRQADYIIIAHPRLLQAIEPLAAFHRQRGLVVEVVAVDDIYDEFNHSIQNPHAIRDFLSYAYHEWQRPAPRFVLLAGDASWDAEGEGGQYKGGLPYASDVPLSHRNMIPTSSFEGGLGRAASDNFFVAVDGDDFLPDMAIGRFPVVEPEVVATIVDKTLGYAQGGIVGPWRRKVLWLSDVSQWMQTNSDGIAEAVTARGFASRKIYPSEDTPSDERTQDPLLQAFDRGQLLVHFFGHGARYVWRTGANRDHRNNYDLFTLEHLHELKPTDKLPMVLSMSCWSAPFDHPSADSIGENFLRLEDRGAVAFLGASWKVGPNKRFSDFLLEELTSTGTIGEAIMRAKRRLKHQNLTENYNLLGDPALELALPKHRLEVAVQSATDEGWEIVATVPDEGFVGRAIVDWLDEAGEVVHSEELEVKGAELEAGFQPANEASAIALVRVYVWNEDAGIDGIGAAALVADQGEQPAEAAS